MLASLRLAFHDQEVTEGKKQLLDADNEVEYGCLRRVG
jgi:hypothetical protein